MRRQQWEFEKAKVFSITKRGKGHYFTHTGLPKSLFCYTHEKMISKIQMRIIIIVDKKFQEWELERWLNLTACSLTQRMFHPTIRTFAQPY